MDRITFTPMWLDKPRLARTKVDQLRAAKATKKEISAAEAELVAAEASSESVPRFFIKLASIIERDQFDAEMEGTYRAAEIAPFQLRDIAVEGLTALLEDEAGELIDLINAEYGGEKLEAKEGAKLKAAIDVLAELWPAYRTAREQEARRARMVPTLAFMRWCDGWEGLSDRKGVAVEYAREKGVIPDEILRRIDPLVIRVVGLEAYSTQYGQGQAGN
ncbi:MAG TPA: hypothetical protein VMQ93_16225 [Novosphingobium sp.]|nr:hypothetical protein [Novosphingobium sp.]